MQQVVIVGAGFGGLEAARRLAGKPVRVTVVDRHNYHLFQPLLYQVATAGLDAQNIAHALRGIFQDADNVDFRLAQATGVDFGERCVTVDAGDQIPYDFLILAAGATTETLGIQGVREHAYPLKTLSDAVRLRDHILRRFEQVDKDPTLVADGALTFVVVGGGPTGVEVCGALVELFDHVLARDFRNLDLAEARIVLVEALPHLLDAYSPPSREYVRRTLESRGVDVVLDAPLEAVGASFIRLAGGDQIPTHTVVWAAGVRAQPLADALDLEQTKGGRIVVERDLSVPGRPDVFVIGDLAGATDPTGALYPQLAPVAQQQAHHAVRQIALRRRGQPTEPFRYRHKGIMATVGRNAAVAELPLGLRLRGFVAWLTWLVAHLLFLVGYRNRAGVLLEWLYNYATYDRASRLIVGWQDEPRYAPAEDGG
ncbi:MAG TPA: NAD(P)/FAD-dependent oxidoreductase [Egibacteraceae bacterium]|nr:NAD(P)/FAD-dependent oxidoreductase [Egibacteraceae bacterium]